MIRYGLPVLALLALAFATFSVRSMMPQPVSAAPPSPPPAAHGLARQVGAVGITESASENIAISTPVPGLVTRVLVQAGDQVKAGQPLFQLDDRDLRAELALRQAAVGVAEARLARLAASPRQEELPPLRARVNEAEAQLADANTQLRLMEAVVDQRAIRREDLERRRRAVDISSAKLREAKASLALVEAGTWAPDLQVARTELAQAQAQVRRVQAELDRLTITAPIAARVLQCRLRAGEYAQAGQLANPLLLLGNVDQLHLRADVDEKDAWRVKAQAPATASVRGNPNQRFPLSFVRFEPYVVPKRNLTGDATERVDTRVLQVIYRLPAETQLYVGQQMDVYIAAEK